MKKGLSAIVMAIFMAITMVGCASMPNKNKSWATVQKIPLTEAFLYVSQNGEIVIYKEGSEEDTSENEEKAESENGTADGTNNNDSEDENKTQDSEDNGNNSPVPGIKIIYQEDDVRADAQLAMYNYSVAYINNRNELVLVSAITGESKVCDTNVTYLNGEGYSKGINQGVLLIAYKVDSTGAIVSSNQFPF